MTFLNPLVLIGLIAAAFPVLFHLFAQRKARRIEFSSLRFLKQLEKSSMRKVKLRQILLLILRTLLVTFLVMAFARPAIRGYLGGFFGASSANTTLVFLVDNSASMEQRTGASGTAFRAAQEAATKLLALLNEGDEVILIPLADVTPGKQYQPLHSVPEIRKAIMDMPVLDAPARLEDGLRLASSALTGSLNINKELYLFSDAQASNFTDSVKEQLTLFDEQTKIYIVEAGTETKGLRNLSLDSVKSLTTIFEPGRPLEFELFIRNGSGQTVENIGVSLFYNDERVAQRTLAAIEPNSTERITLSASPKGSGSLGIRSELEEDALPFDNKRYLAIEIPNARRVGLFFATPADAEYIKLALAQTVSTGDVLPFILEERRLEELRMLPSLRSRLDALIVETGSTLYSEDAKGLSEYLTSGGGVAFFPASSLDVEAFNTNIAAPLGLPAIVRREEAGSSYFSFTQFDLAHPFFSGMFDGGRGGMSQRGIESPKISAYYKFVPGGTPLISLSQGLPFLIELSRGKGKVILTSLTPTFAMSDYPRKGIFLPIIRRTAAYLAAIGSRAGLGTNEFYTDAPFEVSLPDLPGEAPGASLIVRAPDGSTERLQSVASADRRLRLQVTAARQAGIYRVFKDAEGRAPVTSFAVNVRTQEADLARVSSSQMSASLAPHFAQKEKAVAALDITNDFADKVRQSRYGVELWQTFLFIALACAITEMLIAREGKKKSEP